MVSQQHSSSLHSTEQLDDAISVVPHSFVAWASIVYVVQAAAGERIAGQGPAISGRDGFEHLRLDDGAAAVLDGDRQFSGRSLQLQAEPLTV